MKEHNRGIAMDAVCKVAQNGDLAKSLNSLRTVSGAPNPFVVAQRASRNASEVASRPATRSVEQTSSHGK